MIFGDIGTCDFALRCFLTILSLHEASFKISNDFNYETKDSKALKTAIFALF